jgi:thiamine biosynthesis lipoprotein
MRETPPAAAAIQRWRENISVDPGLTLDNRTLSVDRPIKLAFGGIAKGTALNEAAAMLMRMGIRNAIIDAGGDLQVLGMRGDRMWRIGIRDPHSAGVLGTLDVAPGEAIVTSGNYERYFKYQGTRYHHLLDPRTGLPVTHTAGVTVVEADAELADAAATALMVAGAQRFHEIAGRMGIEFALLVTSDGDIIMTPALARLIREPEQNSDPVAGIM